MGDEDQGRQNVAAGRDAYTANRDINNITNIAVNSGNAQALAVPGMLPRDVPQFTGREAELGRLTALAGGGRVVVTAISGTGGVGKTALAVRAAHELLPQFPDGQLYADLRGYAEGQSPAEPAEVLDLFLRRLGVPAEQIPAAADERADMFRSALTARRMLVLLDNARTEAQVRPLLPGAGGSLVLVTSRSRLPALEVDERVDLDVLPERLALELLTRLAGPARVAAEPDAAGRIARWCGRLPLALRIAGQILAVHPTWPVARLERMLASEQGRLGHLSVGDLQVKTTIEVSYRQLTAEDARAFRLLGLHFSPDFDAASVAALADVEPAGATATLARLVAAALVTEDGWGRYSVHDLLRLFTRDTCLATDDQAARSAAEERLIRHYGDWAASLDSRIDPARRPAAERTPGPLLSIREALALVAADRRGFLAAIDLAAARQMDEVVEQLSARLWHALVILRHLADLLVLNMAMLASTRRANDAAGEARALNALGIVNEELGRHHDAIEAHQQAFAIFKDAGDRYGEGQALGSLGIIYLRLGQRDDAISTYQRALAIRREFGDRLGEGRTLSNLGNAYRAAGRLNDAITAHQQALMLFREAGDRHSEGQALNNLGVTYQTLGRHADAIGAYTLDVAICHETGDQHGRGQALYNLGTAYEGIRSYDRAAACYREAIVIMREAGDHARAARYARTATAASRQARRHH